MGFEYQKLSVRPLSGALGAEIHGVDLSQPLDNETFSDIHKAFVDHLVIFFRDQQMTPEQHLAFARRFGPLHIHPYAAGMKDRPEIIEIIKEREETHNWGDGWHTDVPFEERPPLGSILYSKEVPPFSGDTFFSNMYLAYETLSEGLRKTLDGLTGVYVGDNALYDNFAAMPNQKQESLIAEHPLVRTHIDTGKKSLYLSKRFLKRFKDWSEEESRPLINFLQQHAERPEFTCRFHWEVNSVAFWDNRCTLHLANCDYFYKARNFSPSRRRMHRVTIIGERPQ
jgi:taurine dioxygenase